MRIRCGTTRFVFLIGNEAIKIGRIRPLRFLARMLIFPFSRKRREHFFTKYGPTFWKAALNDLCAGLYANRNEYEYYRESRDFRVMPTIKQLLRGWIVVQLRGDPVSSNELSEAPFIKQQIGTENCEVTEEAQFCRHPKNRRIVLVDYGRRATLEALAMTA